MFSQTNENNSRLYSLNGPHSLDLFIIRLQPANLL